MPGSPKPAQAPRPILRAGLWMTGTIASFTLMAIAGRAASLDHDTFEIMLYRSILGFGIVVGLAAAFGTLGQVQRSRLGLHGLRNVAHFTGQNLWFYAITLAPLAQVFALEFTTPIWVILLAPLFLGERFTWLKGVAVMLGFAGILMVARPDVGGLTTGVIFAALSAVGFAVTAICTKRLTEKESITSIMFWLTGLQVLLGLVFAGYDGDIALPAAASLPWLLVIAIAGLLAHFCLTNALAVAPASVVTPLDFARLPVIAVVGALLYDEPFSPWIALGAALIFAGNWLNIRFGAAVNRPKGQ